MEIDAGGSLVSLGYLKTQVRSPVSGAERPRPKLCAGCPFEVDFIEARHQARYWKSQHQRAREREEKLKQEVERLQAKIKDLERKLFGRRSEKGGATQRDGGGSQKAKSPRQRGQQAGRPGPKRRDTSHLEAKEETYTLSGDACRCSRCGLPFRECLGVEESEVIEIEVKAYKRRLRRQRYQPTCGCDHLPGILTAAAPPKLIPKGRYGISLWVTILLDKYCFQRPTHRLLDDLRTHGIDLPMGTVTGGLKQLAPVFVPIREGLIRKTLEETQWHADETSWRVQTPEEEVDSKTTKNSKWSLWVFESRSAAVFVLDPTRKARVPEQYFEGVEQGVLIVDRASVYKAMVQVKEGRIVLAFCWAHVRRDFLGVAKDWSGHEEWGLLWVGVIAEIYHLNNLRLQAEHDQFAARDKALRVAVERMKKRYEEELSNPQLHPVRRKPLKSLSNHWPGLTLFVDHPEIPMDNNQGERTLRGPVCGRKQFFGSGARWSGQLAAALFSLFATLRLWAINPRLWLTAYLQACAEAGGQAPADAERWLPWNLPLDERTAMAELPSLDDTS
jgi:transposase